MDFSSLARRDLQALCKKNKIPANITNVAMIDALNSLQIVEGIEEFLKPLQYEMAHSSIESPEKSAIAQGTVPRTACRTSNRKQPVREESRSLQSLTRTCRGTRRGTAGEVEEANNNAKESEEDRKIGDQLEREQKIVPETPAAAPSTLRQGMAASARRKINSQLVEEDEKKRGMKEKSTMVRRVCSTRRSARLSVKEMAESIPPKKERTQPIKIDPFSEEMQENLVAEQKEELGEVLGNMGVSGIDLQTMLEDDSQAFAGQNSDASSEAVKEVKVTVQEKGGDNYEVDDHPKAKPEEVSDAFDESDVLGPGEHSNLMIEKDGNIEEESDENNKGGDDSKAQTEVRYERCDALGLLSGENLDMQNEDLENKVDVFPSDTENTSEHLKFGNEEESNADVDLEDTTDLNMKNDVLENKVDAFSADLNSVQDQDCTSYNPELYAIQDLVTEEESNGNGNANATADDAKTNLVSNEDQDLELRFSFEDNSSGKISGGDDLETDSNLLEHIICSEPFDNGKESYISEILNCKDSEEFSCTDEAVVDSSTDSIDICTGEILNCVYSEEEKSDEAVVDSIDSIDVYTGEITSDSKLKSENPLTEESGIQVAVDFSLQNEDMILSNVMEMPEMEPTHEHPLSCDKTTASPLSCDKTTASVKLLSPSPASIFADDPLPDQFSSSLVGSLLGPDHNIARPTRLTPVNKSSVRRMTHVSDDKENIDHSGKKLELAKEKGQKANKEKIVDEQRKVLSEASLRQLTKMLKEKLQISNSTKNEEETNISKVAKTRLALQTLPENRLVAGELEKEN